MINLKYYAGVLLSIPLLPFMYYESRKIRSRVPKLPEASGTTGYVFREGRKDFQLVAIGESTIAGVGVDSHEEGFTGTLAREISALIDQSVDWKVFAKSGLSVRRVIDEILPAIPEFDADLVVIGVGANDAFEVNSIVRWNKHVQELIHRVRKKFGNIPIAFTNMPPIKEFPAFTGIMKLTIGNLAEIMGGELNRLVARHENVYFNQEPLKLATFENRSEHERTHEEFFSDGVHPSGLTYRLWAKDFADYLMEHVLR